MATLPPSQREVFVLKAYEELSFPEIAQVLQLPLGTVKARIHRARNMIQQILAARKYEI